jgi:hypothetical protein
LAQFRTTADLIDLILMNGGEVTNGNSSYETQVLNYVNRVHLAIIAGGTIPIGKDQTVEIDESWSWARSARPLIMELQPKYETGTVSVTLGSEAATLSVASASSLQGWHLKIDGKDEWFRIASHSAGGTAIELDGAYPDATNATATFEAIKLEYELIPDFIVIDSTNNKIQFQKAASTPLTGTLTAGTYSPSALATHVAAVITAATTVITVTGAYSAVTRKFTFTSDLAGPSIFQIIGDGSQSAFSAHKTLGFDDETTASAAAQTSTYVLGGIARLIEPFKIHKSAEGSVYGIDPESFQRDYPFSDIYEGNPDRFSVIREAADGTLTVRFNGYPTEKTRIEVDHIPIPRDLKDSTSSIPQIPRKHADVLEDAGTFYLMINKSDDRAQVYANLLQGKLKAMVAQHRGSLLRGGKDFGRIVPRRDMLGRGRRRFDASGGYT